MLSFILKGEYMKGYKAFNITKNGKRCLNYNFENKEIHEIKGELEVCFNGFHFCKKLEDVFDYYKFDKNNVAIHEIEALGEVLKDGNKSVTNKLKIGRKLSNKEVFDNEKVQLEAVKQNGSAIKYIKNPSEKVQLEAVKENGWAIEFIENPSEEVKLAAVKQRGFSIYYIKNPSEKIQLEAVKQRGWSIKYIENPSEKVQLEAVKQNGWAIQFIKNPSEEVKLETVKQNGWAIVYIENPSEKVQIAAANKRGWIVSILKTLQKKLKNWLNIKTNLSSK